MREKRRPSNTFAWLLIIILAPYIGVPLYILFGGRKIARLKKTKKLLVDQPNRAEGTTDDGLFSVVSGNRNIFLNTGTEAYECLMREIRNAKESIDITTFILSHDEVGRMVVKALSEKAKQGLRVRVLLDALGSFGKKALYMLELEKAGGEIERFMPVLPLLSMGRANLRNHRKIAIFDGERAIIGGRNIGKEYMGQNPNPKRWRDFGVLIHGPATMKIQSVFEADWAYARRKRKYAPKAPKHVPPLEGEDTSEIQIMASGPDTISDPFYEKLLTLIHEAKESITIATPYYIPDEVLQRSLFVKAKSGKTVKVIVPRRSNHPVTDLARKHYLKELEDAGAHILYFTKGMMHGKVVMVDRMIATTGSANIDFRSLFVNYEIAAFFYSSHDIDRIAEWIDSIERDSIPMAQAYTKEPTLLKVVAEDICRLLAPLL